MPEKTRVNVVELLAGDDETQAFDQPCIHGNRVGFHSVYCHSIKAGYRKCCYRFEPVATHQENACGDYTPNPRYDPNWAAKEQT